MLVLLVCWLIGLFVYWFVFVLIHFVGLCVGLLVD